jgi:hypothetical protein
MIAESPPDPGAGDRRFFYAPGAALNQTTQFPAAHEGRM